MADDPNTLVVDDSKLAAWGLDDDDEQTPAPDVVAPSPEAPPATPPSEPVEPGTADPTPAPPVPPTTAPASPPVSATTVPPSEQPPSETPYAFKADGKDLPITGFKLANGDLRIPAATAAKLHHYLADRTEVQRVLTERQRTETDLRSQVDTAKQTNVGLLERFQQMLDLAASDPEGLIAYALKARAELPTYVSEMQAKQRDTETEQLRQRLAEVELERNLPQLEPVWRENVTQRIAQMVANDPSLSDVDAKVLADAAWEDRHSAGLLVRAPVDAPDGSFKKGDVAVSLPVLAQLVQQHARTERRIAAERQKITAAQAAETERLRAAAQNAAILQPTTKAPVLVNGKTPSGPVVRQKQVVSGRPRNADGTFMSEKDGFDKEWADLDLSPDE